VPNVPYGVPFIIAAAGSFSIGVRTTPGEIALTRSRSAGGHFGRDRSGEKERRLDVDRVDLVEHRFVDGRRG
jgi:hypothetical protein